MQIDPKHTLPCDFTVGHIRFLKGVKLETVRVAAERWHKLASEATAGKMLPKYDLEKLLEGR